MASINSIYDIDWYYLTNNSEQVRPFHLMAVTPALKQRVWQAPQRQLPLPQIRNKWVVSISRPEGPRMIWSRWLKREKLRSAATAPVVALQRALLATVMERFISMLRDIHTQSAIGKFKLHSSTGSNKYTFCVKTLYLERSFLNWMLAFVVNLFYEDPNIFYRSKWIVSLFSPCVVWKIFIIYYYKSWAWHYVSIQ